MFLVGCPPRSWRTRHVHVAPYHAAMLRIGAEPPPPLMSTPLIGSSMISRRAAAGDLSASFAGCCDDDVILLLLGSTQQHFHRDSGQSSKAEDVRPLRPDMTVCGGRPRNRVPLRLGRAADRTRRCAASLRVQDRLRERRARPL